MRLDELIFRFNGLEATFDWEEHMRTKSTLVAAILTVVVVALMTQLPDVSRAEPASPNNQVTSTLSTAVLPIAVDGDKRPDLVPDHIAYTHFILSVSTLS